VSEEEVLMAYCASAEFVVEDTGEDFELVKIVSTVEGKLRFVLTRVRPET